MTEENTNSPLIPTTTIKQSKNTKVPLLVGGFLFLLVIIGMLIWMLLASQKASRDNQQSIEALEQQLVEQQESQQSPTSTIVSPTENPESEVLVADSTLTSLDETWNLYTNAQLGFSIKVPNTMYHPLGSMCKWQENSYRPNGGIVPVKIFEGTSVFFSSEYFYDLKGETVSDSTHYYSNCDKITNSLAILENKTYWQQFSWEFVTKTVGSEAELQAFIRERYGSGCTLGDQTPASQPGVFDVGILGDGKDLEDTQCPLNYATVLKYYPAKNIVISWHLGQASTFAADQNNQVVYDQEMVKSFLFL